MTATTFRVKSGGIVVTDNLNWSTTTPAVGILKSKCDELFSPSEAGPSISF